MIVFNCSHKIKFSIFINDKILKAKRQWQVWKNEFKVNIINTGPSAEASASFVKMCKSIGVSTKYENIKEAKKHLQRLGILYCFLYVLYKYKAHNKYS